jgi:HSP20 family molecular chaperone IbpA
MDVPGVRSEDFEIELQNDMLTVRGARPFPYQTQDGDGTLRRAEPAHRIEVTAQESQRQQIEGTSQ